MILHLMRGPLLDEAGGDGGGGAAGGGTGGGTDAGGGTAGSQGGGTGGGQGGAGSGGRSTGGDGGGGGDEHPATRRIKALLRENQELQVRYAELEQRSAKVLELERDHAKLRSDFELLQQTHAGDQARWQDERSLLQAGLTDPEAVELARVYYGKVPEDQRPKEGGLGAWWGTLKADPTKAPRGLQPFLTADGGAAGAGDQGHAGSTAGGGVVHRAGGASAGEPISAERIRELYQEAERTGDWSKYDAVRANLTFGPR